MKKKAKSKKRLVRGKDWHAWAFKDVVTGELSFESYFDRRNFTPLWRGEKWVRVRFVEVKP